MDHIMQNSLHRNVQQRRNYVRFLGYLSLGLLFPGIMLSLIPQPFIASFGISLMVMGGLTGIRAMFSGLFRILFSRQTGGLGAESVTGTEDPKSELGRKNLTRHRRRRFAEAALGFIGLIIALSVIIMTQQLESTTGMGFATGAAVALIPLQMLPLYAAITTDQLLKSGGNE